MRILCFWWMVSTFIIVQMTLWKEMSKLITKQGLEEWNEKFNTTYVNIVFFIQTLFQNKLQILQDTIACQAQHAILWWRTQTLPGASGNEVHLVSRKDLSNNKHVPTFLMRNVSCPLLSTRGQCFSFLPFVGTFQGTVWDVPGTAHKKSQCGMRSITGNRFKVFQVCDSAVWEIRSWPGCRGCLPKALFQQRKVFWHANCFFLIMQR